MDTTNLILAIFLVYWAAVAYLNKKGVLEKYNISAYGPILMIRTVRGLAILDKLAKPRRYWRVFANTGIVLMFIGMFAMLFIVILSDIALISSLTENAMPQPGKFNEARNVFLIPGVNEFIPLTWGIIALVVTLVVHEFAHAILARVEDIRVKSMGILFALVPIGGFAEPDEEQLFGEGKDEFGSPAINEKKATRNQRARILAAGVMSNFAVALIAFVLFFGPVLGAVAPMSDTMVVDVKEDSVADIAGIEKGMVITGIDDREVRYANDVVAYLNKTETGSTVTLKAAKDQEIREYELKVTGKQDTGDFGIYINDIVDGSPAERSNLEKGMFLLSINNVTTQTPEEFVNFMNTTTAGQEVEIEVKTPEGENEIYTLTLGQHPDGNSEKGFLGVYYGTDGVKNIPLGLSIGEYPAHEYLDMLKGLPSMLTGVAGWVILLGLPIIGFAGEGFPGFSGTFAQFYEPVGWGEPLGVGIFWIANSLLWIGWLNFYVGLFNCLPAVPLDGGHVFRDYLQSFLKRFTGDEIKSTTLAGTIAGTFTILIILSFVLMIFGPYIVHGF